ncbi:MAG: DegT/DnrJ/EryC1/StrS family aminotransferase [Stellaceae bacterium]
MLARVRSNLSLNDIWRAALADEPRPAEALEQAFADRFGYPYGVLFPYARSALLGLLQALHWREREVLCPAYICAEVPYAVTLSGNRARLVDSAPDHFLPGSAEWRAAVTPSSAMAIITPLFGYPVDRDCEGAIRAAAPDAFILYDAAQSYGAFDSGGLQARNADGMLFSLGLGKMVTALSGGVLLLRDAAIHRAVREFRDAACVPPRLAHTLKQAARTAAVWLAFREPALSLVDLLGRRLGMFPTEGGDWLPPAVPQHPSDGAVLPAALQARIGLRQFANLDGFLAARSRIAQYYERRLREEDFRTFGHSHRPNWTRYPLAVAAREATAAGLRSEGVQVSLFLPYSCAQLPVYRDQAERCPNAAIWARSMINLPNWHGLSADQAERIVDILLRLRDRDSQSVAWPQR